MVRNALLLVPLVALTSAVAFSQSPSDAPAGPLTVTTDSPAYCDGLAARIAAERQARVSTQPDVQRLADEGQRMCDHGLIRGGLLRLRRALLMLEGQKQAGYPSPGTP